MIAMLKLKRAFAIFLPGNLIIMHRLELSIIYLKKKREEWEKKREQDP